ncbi:hypothetical protein [Undibacterium baiyunense]|uniref:Uncharacterized protein n=1 Tax=Undibacterium baiyunense TaxID=2828731 RepID=A0A941DET6_9BURK|nr:hypothetical protein [Undibacterium baiyunense]MBR7747444.1 hypothetical protein [Undibacterium baiyunense]
MTSEKKSVQLAILVGELKENLIAHIEIEQLQARLIREKYLALVKNGFTETQALELCKR